MTHYSDWKSPLAESFTRGDSFGPVRRDKLVGLATLLMSSSCGLELHHEFDARQLVHKAREQVVRAWFPGTDEVSRPAVPHFVFELQTESITCLNKEWSFAFTITANAPHRIDLDVLQYNCSIVGQETMLESFSEPWPNWQIPEDLRGPLTDVQALMSNTPVLHVKQLQLRLTKRWSRIKTQDVEPDMDPGEPTHQDLMILERQVAPILAGFAQHQRCADLRHSAFVAACAPIVPLSFFRRKRKQRG
jgi:hypothetical protein